MTNKRMLNPAYLVWRDQIADNQPPPAAAGKFVIFSAEDGKACVECERHANAQRAMKEQQGEQDIAALLNWQKERDSKDKT
jgi:hypothetical protein